MVELPVKEKKEASFAASHWDANTRHLTWFTRGRNVLMRAGRLGALPNPNPFGGVRADKTCPSSLHNGPGILWRRVSRVRRRRATDFLSVSKFPSDSDVKETPQRNHASFYSTWQRTVNCGPISESFADSAWLIRICSLNWKCGIL